MYGSYNFRRIRPLPRKFQSGCWLAGWLAGWLFDWLAHWLLGWLCAGWLLAHKIRAAEYQQKDSCHRIRTIRFVPELTNISRVMPFISRIMPLINR